LITYHVAKLRDFIKFAENTLKMSDGVPFEFEKSIQGFKIAP